MSYTVGDYTDTRIGLLPPDLQDLITEMALEPIILIQRVVHATNEASIENVYLPLCPKLFWYAICLRSQFFRPFAP